ncbi:hypothetical protein [Actinomadura viridis]|uniref:Uncharacterized protein n=1 Tax=Actinomadura viridis TaxID=58110 RepID=A0A931DKS6_9ACTN|nr:hypothetical protein [Actinomadura viridis]MBG6091825.1 hypothetical protein [Actinomadura viridis]
MLSPDGEKRAAVVAAPTGTWTHSPATATDVNSSLSAITAVPNGDMWAAGAQLATGKAVVQRLGGGGWSRVQLPASLTDLSLTKISASSPTNVWAAGRPTVSGGSTKVIRWNGTAWQAHSFPLSFFPGALAAVDARNVWVGSGSATTGKRWNGTTWSDTQIGIWTNAFDAVSADDVWAVGMVRTADGGARPATAHWNGTSWTTVPFPQIDGIARGEMRPHLTDVHAVSANDVWAVGSVPVTGADGKVASRSLLAHWDGTRWTNTLGEPGTSLAGIESDGAGGFWIRRSRGVMQHRSATGAVTETTLPAPTGRTAEPSTFALRPGTTTVWAVGRTQDPVTKTFTAALWSNG